MNQTIYMIFGGAGAYFTKVYLGHHIDGVIFNHLSQSRGYFAQVVLYVGLFFVIQGFCSRQKTLDINSYINPRDRNGELFLGIIM